MGIITLERLSPTVSDWWGKLSGSERAAIEAIFVQNSLFDQDDEVARIERAYEISLRLERNTSVTLVDFARRGHRSYVVPHLKRALGIVPQIDRATLERHHGVVSHQVLPILMEGRRPAYRKPQVIHTQLSVFGETPDERNLELSLFNPDKEWPSLEHVEFLRDLPKVVIDDLARTVSLVQRNLRGASFYDRTDITLPARPMLAAMLRPIVGHFVDRLPHQREDPLSLHYVALTLIEWASAILYAVADGGVRSYFKELRVSDPRNGFSAGRIDALEVTKVGGHPLLAREQRIVEALASKRYGSIATLHATLLEYLGPHTLRLLDWKCAVGDFAGRRREVRPKDCPDAKHVEQMERYLAVIPTIIAAHRHIPREKLWKRNLPVASGARLVFFLPDYEVFMRRVQLSPEGRRDVFERLVDKWGDAEQRSEHRGVTNGVLQTFRRALSTGSMEMPSARIRNERLELPTSERNFSAVVNSHRSL